MTTKGARILVTGVTGLLGSALVRMGAADYDVHGLARHPGAARLPGTMHQADITGSRCEWRWFFAFFNKLPPTTFLPASSKNFWR